MATPAVRPDPDPSVMTTAQLEKAIANSDALTNSHFATIDVRLNAMDKAVTLVHDDFVRVPTLLDRAVDNLLKFVEGRVDGKTALLDERITSIGNVTSQQFLSINDKFAEKDKAVSVGLSAQKESAAAQQDSNTTATSKMENNFTKLLEQGQQLVSEIRRNTDTQLSAINSRLDRGEGKSQGIMIILGVGQGLVVVIVAIVALFLRH